MGGTGIKFIHYAIGSLGMIPATIVFVFIGTTASDIADFVCWKSLGSILGFFGIVFISMVAKKQLALITEKDDDKAEKM